uniref:Uncharacterized protein n=1 Tax=Glossina pallidipes TaxID=7398 RepID=A0A1A9ZAT5_GLOPL
MKPPLKNSTSNIGKFMLLAIVTATKRAAAFIGHIKRLKTIDSYNASDGGSFICARCELSFSGLTVFRSTIVLR